MADLTLYIGNRNYSSWSFRAWLALKRTGAPFREVLFHLGDPSSREQIRRVSPGGKVPALHHGSLVIWESVAIAEYLAETFPDARLWPEDRERRAIARAVVAEMHAGFTNLRRSMPMNVRRSSPGAGWGPGVQEDVERITAMWADCLRRFGTGGPFLFGAYSLADVFYAPVVSRFQTYAVELEPLAEGYAHAVWNHPDVREWRAAAEAEEMVEAQYDL